MARGLFPQPAYVEYSPGWRSRRAACVVGSVGG